jgi:hypothetical protein
MEPVETSRFNTSRPYFTLRAKLMLDAPGK